MRERTQADKDHESFIKEYLETEICGHQECAQTRAQFATNVSLLILNRDKDTRRALEVGKQCKALTEFARTAVERAPAGYHTGLLNDLCNDVIKTMVKHYGEECTAHAMEEAFAVQDRIERVVKSLFGK